MDQKIADTKNRIFRFFTDVDSYHRTIFFRNDTVHSQWKCHPLIFLDTAIIMRIQQCHIRILIQRILFQIQTRGIDMCAEDIHAIFHWLLTNDVHGKTFPFVICKYAVTGFQRDSFCDHCFHILKTGCYCTFL